MPIHLLQDKDVICTYRINCIGHIQDISMHSHAFAKILLHDIPTPIEHTL